jgi:DinB superfamily
MHPRTLEILEHLDRHRASVRAAVELIPPARQATRPAPDRWSAVEVVEHLVIVETRIASMFAERMNAARHGGLGAEAASSPILPSLDVVGLLDRSRPVVAGENSQPRGGLTMDQAWANLDEARLNLKQAILATDGLALEGVRAPHRLLGSLNMYQWLIFVGTHEGRHALQIREVAAALGVA